MDSRERTFLALDHQEPDRVPLDLWMSNGFRNKLRAETEMLPEAFLDENDVDLRYLPGPRYIGPPLRRYEDGSEEDIWGVRRTPSLVPVPGGEELYMEVAVSPLAEATRMEDITAYPGWPSPDWFEYTEIAEQCRQIRDQGRVAVFMGDRLNRVAQLKPAMYLRGVEQILADLALAPELAAAVIRRVREFYLKYAERIFDAAAGQLDLLLMGDDFGSQSGPLVSPAMWKQYLQQGFAQFIDLAHSYGVRVMHHTCGAVRPLIPLFIDSGLDVLQSLQPEAAGMDAAVLKHEFGGRITFHGGLSIQQTLPFGSTDEVRTEVRDKIRALASGGGYILGTAHNLQADVPLANARAMLAAHREFGAYPVEA